MEITTSGDETSRTALSSVGDKSRFVKEIEEALLRDDVDLAVHSAKDVPGGELPEGLAIVGVPAREDARDALCGAATLEDLPEGASVGTSSLRRRAQLLAARPDLRVSDLRGNVDTRLRKLAEGSHDAVVLALAGLKRLGRQEGAPLPVALLTPAPGQGCLALEARRGDAHVAELAARLTDQDALVCLTAERAVVERLGATCHTPVAAYAELYGEGELELAAFVGMPDGSTWIRDALAGTAADPAALGREVADRLLAAGASDVLAAAEG
ncbi:MAG: hydroxymethylbilane synthase [Thermoleophilaceae bacterium]|nr:hydroxymethylbilane synthase [Thermoleophilaceae bacterium]